MATVVKFAERRTASKNTMKALVIGGNGFIGSHLVELLLEESTEVRVFDRYPNRFGQPVAGVEYIVGDMGNHGEAAHAVKGVDWVFHLAYTTLPETSNDDPVYDVRSNVVDTLQLLQECCAQGVKKVVFISSGGTVYGVPKTVPIHEDHSTEPICSYGITKLTIEKYLALFQRVHGLEYVVARLSNPYGERQNPQAKQGAVGVFLGRIARGEKLTIWGDGEVVRDYVYIKDACKALISAAKYKPGATDPRIFNVGSGAGCSLNELVDALRKVVDARVEVEYTASRVLDVPANVLDVSLAKKHLNWSPTTTMDDGLRCSWNWIKSLTPAT